MAQTSQFCKYREFPRPGRKWCPYGCTKDVTVCHKWAKQDCYYQEYARCSKGVHYEPPGAFGSASAEGPKKQRRDAEGPKRQRRDADSMENTAQQVLDLIKKDPVLSGNEHEKQAHLKRLLRTLHPDKVHGTTLEPLFDTITKAIVKMKEDV